MRVPAVAAALSLLLGACGSGSDADRVAGPVDAAPVRTAPDPALAGPHAAAGQEYHFGRMTVRDETSGAEYETDIHGVLHAPAQGAGPFPVILLLHGRHQTCETGPGQLPVPVGDDRCPGLAPVLAPANSYRGYDELATNLASHGYAVLSIDANDINDNDGSASAGDAGALARAELVLRHLDAFRKIAARGGSGFDALRGRLDFSRVGLMGHSRGGEGVAKAVSVNAVREHPHAIRAVFALAPTDYNGQAVPHVAFATLLPYCDGDVENLMGAFAYDASRYAAPDDTTPKFQILAMGANHNYFNTVWTSDDWTIHGLPTDPHCGTQASTHQRDTPEGQRALGLFFMASFFRHFVGGERDFGAYWSGQAQVPASACPEGLWPCDARYPLSVHAPADRRLLIDATPADTALAVNALGLPVRLEGFSSSATCTATGADGGGCPAASPTFSTASQLVLSWDAGARYTSVLGDLDAAGFDSLTLRVGVSHGDADNAGGQDFEVVLVDRSGHRASVSAADYTQALFDPPGGVFADGGSEKTTLNGLRIPLAAFTGVDPHHLAQLELVFGSRSPAGTLQLTDLMFQRLAP